MILADANDALAGNAPTKVGLFSHGELEMGRLALEWLNHGPLRNQLFLQMLNFFFLAKNLLLKCVETGSNILNSAHMRF